MLCFMLSLENSNASYLVPNPPREREIMMERKSIENEINVDGTARLLEPSLGTMSLLNIWETWPSPRGTHI